MKPSFLGKSYEMPYSTIDGIETEETLTYTDKQYKPKQYNVPPSPQ